MLAAKLDLQYVLEHTKKSVIQISLGDATHSTIEDLECILILKTP